MSGASVSHLLRRRGCRAAAGRLVDALDRPSRRRAHRRARRGQDHAGAARAGRPRPGDRAAAAARRRARRRRTHRRRTAAGRSAARSAGTSASSARFTSATRLLVVTEGILTARLQQDPLLSDVTTIVLDEFHERSIHLDLGLALARQAWLARDDLHLLVMSATLDAGAGRALPRRLPGARTCPARRTRLHVEYAPGEGRGPCRRRPAAAHAPARSCASCPAAARSSVPARTWPACCRRQWRSCRCYGSLDARGAGRGRASGADAAA